MRVRSDCSSARLTWAMSWPKASTRPRCAVSWPVAARNSVVLPEPEPPMMATTSPARTSMEMSRKTVKSP
ncbi:hypothetical protein D3C78_1746260 [compost metagenome]